MLTSPTRVTACTPTSFLLQERNPLTFLITTTQITMSLTTSSKKMINTLNKLTFTKVRPCTLWCKPIAILLGRLKPDKPPHLLVSVQGAIVHWRASTERIIIPSTAAGEYVALSRGNTTAKYVNNVPKFYGNPPTPYYLYTDNQAAEHIATQPNMNEHSRSIDTRHHAIRQDYEDGHMRIGGVVSAEHTNDILAKYLQPPLHEKHAHHLHITQEKRPPKTTLTNCVLHFVHYNDLSTIRKRPRTLTHHQPTENGPQQHKLRISTRIPRSPSKRTYPHQTTKETTTTTILERYTQLTRTTLPSIHHVQTKYGTQLTHTTIITHAPHVGTAINLLPSFSRGTHPSPHIQTQITETDSKQNTSINTITRSHPYKFTQNIDAPPSRFPDLNPITHGNLYPNHNAYKDQDHTNTSAISPTHHNTRHTTNTTSITHTNPRQNSPTTHNITTSKWVYNFPVSVLHSPHTMPKQSPTRRSRLP
jgi:hypothetical protein